MKSLFQPFFIVVFSVAIGISCMWDTDTIEMEKQKFPEVYDLITGRFVRHSPEYYEWRIQDRLEKLKSDPNNLQNLDDLAVGYSKLKQDKEAIKIMLRKEKMAPGKYETYANLGTFYLHDGQLKKGIEYIEKAIEINPDAHFGREIYQKYLAEYLLSKGFDKDKTLPISKESDFYIGRNAENQHVENFYGFLVEKKGFVIEGKKKYNNILPQEEVEKAVKGITGMMKFGNYDSPILLEVLGDLLAQDAGNWRGSSNRNLAIYAYSKAKKSAKNKTSEKSYDIKIRGVAVALSGEKRAIKKIVTSLNSDIKRGEHFYNQIRENELKWIAEGADVDAKFAEVYYGTQPEVKSETKESDSTSTSEEKIQEEDVPASEGSNFFNWMIGVLLLSFLIGLFLFIKRNKR